jgi:hypothetical protein
MLMPALMIFLMEDVVSIYLLWRCGDCHLAEAEEIANGHFILQRCASLQQRGPHLSRRNTAISSRDPLTWIITKQTKMI